MKAFFIIILFSIPGFSFSQKVELTSSIDKNVIFIGEQLQLTLKAIIPKDLTVEWPRVDSILHFEVISKSTPDSQLNANTLILTEVITLTSWDSGRWQLPSFSIAGSKKTKTITVDVTFSPFDPEQDYHDVKDILEVPKPARSTWHWYLIGAILLLLLFILLFPSRKVKKQTTEFVADETVFKQSLSRIEKLKKDPPADAKILYTELIEIFREYLFKRKGIQSHSKTSDDLSIQMGALNLELGTFKPLAQTLQLSDLVKFAQLKTASGENDTSIETIKQSIIAIENIK
jgi:hypothetical protein